MTVDELNENLSAAVAVGSIEDVKKFIKEGADINFNDKYGGIYLHTAAQFDEAEIARILIENGIDIHQKDFFHANTPLHIAAGNGSVRVAKILLERGADREIKNNSGRIPLDLASTVKIRELLSNNTSQNNDLDKQIANANVVLESLDKLSYFKFVSKENLETAKENLIDNFVSEHTLSCGFDDDLLPFNPRECLVDAEILAEDGLESIIEQMSPLLIQEGVQVFDIKSVVSTDTWDSAYNSLIQIVNGLLDKTPSKESLYAQSHFVNDGSVIFLTNELFNYIKSLDIKESWLPRNS
jgi:hypothetical protein